MKANALLLAAMLSLAVSTCNYRNVSASTTVHAAGQTGVKHPHTHPITYWLTGLGNRGNGHALYHSYRVFAGGCVRRGHGRDYCGKGGNSISHGRTHYGRVYHVAPHKR